MKAVIKERGNGFPDIGDFVAGSDGELYVVASIVGPIHTGRSPGAPGYIHATVELADWGDCDEDSEPTCSCDVEED